MINIYKSINQSFNKIIKNSKISIEIDEHLGIYKINTWKSGQLIKIIGRENVERVRVLIVCGPINRVDVFFIRKMIKLEELDLSKSFLVKNTIDKVLYKIMSNRNSLCFLGGNKYIRKIVLPLNVGYIPDYAFANCINLKEITFTNSIKYIGRKSFYRTGISKVVIPKSVKYINHNAFLECRFLEEIIFEDGKSDIKWEYDSFKLCHIKKIYLGRNSKYDYDNELYDVSSLKNIIIGKNIRHIYMDLSDGLESITCFCKKPPILKNYFNIKCKLIVPEEYYTDYWLDPIWGKLDIEKLTV